MTWTRALRRSGGWCTQAERFAAAVLMQPRAFAPLALEWGLDVLKLQQAFRCSYAAVSIRLAEVLRDPPLMVVLYGRGDGRDPENGNRPPKSLRAKVVRRTRGLVTPSDFPICGERGGIPRWGRPIRPGSLAERPPAMNGALAMVVVVAVPESYPPGRVASDQQALPRAGRPARPPTDRSRSAHEADAAGRAECLRPNAETWVCRPPP